MIKLKPLFVVLGWASSLAGFVLAAIFNSYLLPSVVGNGGGLLPEVLNANPLGNVLPYLGAFGASLIAALVISDASKAILSLFPAYGLGAVLTYLVLDFPALSGTFQPPAALEQVATTFTISAFFPIVLLSALAGTIMGIFLAERVS